MAQHLKSSIIRRLKCAVSYYAPHSEISASHRRGVRYFVPIVGINMLYGAMNTHKEGRHYQKHIIVRRIPRTGGQLLQLYTYHFPKTWSAACVANRELIKEAQRQAHALEHDHSLAAIDWHIRFLHHYFTVCRGGAKPEPGLKPYSRFYQYTYVVIYRELKAAQQAAKENAEVTVQPLMPEEVTFDPIDYRPLRARRTYPLQHAIRVNICDEVYPPPLFLPQKVKIPINRYCLYRKKAVILQRD